MSRVLTTLKRLMPDRVRTQIARPLREMLTSPGIEYEVLRPCHFTPDPSAAPRLTLILPSLSQREAFGGVTTALQVFLDLALALRNDGACDIRILTERDYNPDDSALGGYLTAAGLGDSDVQIASLRQTNQTIAMRRDELIVNYNWWISLNTTPVLEAQAAHFDRAPLPKLSLIQEYEPQFYPFSSAHLLALHAFNGDWPLWGVFNSSELYDYYIAQGNRADQAFVFEPRMTAKIGAFAGDITADEKTRTILVYGRPQIPRNCFSLLEKGLRDWAASGDRSGWRVVSAGAAHRDIDLGHGQKLTSLGKLSLDEYGQLLRETAVGLSLMSSPHPSYPPLEMAHFGARTVTNAYANKDLTTRHENLISLPNIMPATIGRVLGETTDQFETDPAAGIRAQSHMPDYMQGDGFDCLPDLAKAVRGLFAEAPS